MENGSTALVMSGATPRRPYRVLVVDDDSTNLILATEVIRLHGAIPVACEDAQTALSQFADDHWDIVFMDIRMPGMNGLEAAKAFREIEAAMGRPHVPIIALTAGVLPAERQQCLEHGMDDVLGKPYSVLDFGTMLDHWCSQALPRHEPATVTVRQSGVQSSTSLASRPRRCGSAARPAGTAAPRREVD
jgi:CheY-like chemotaxis protein